MKKYLSIFLILLLGLAIRFYLTRYGNSGGDILVVAEWGKRFWEIGPKSFYFDKSWYYSPPTYPPLSSLMYAGLYWLFERNHILAQVHNAVKVIPAAFIIWFNEILQNPLFFRQGYFTLLKTPAILADIGIGVLIYKIVKDLTKERKKALFASAFFVLNPLTIFLSSVWGQTESLFSFFGLLSFYLLYYKKEWLSVPLFLLSLFVKPTMAIFIPLYLFVLYLKKENIKGILIGSLFAIAIFLITTVPFSGNDILGFSREIVFENLLPSAKGTARASISAFNFHSLFLKIDRNIASDKILGIQAQTIGYLSYFAINIFTFSYLSKKKKSLLLPLTVSLFSIGLGSFLFLTNMLERYFFASFAPMVVLMFAEPKVFLYGLLGNLILLSNLIFAFYRGVSDEIGRPFTNNNFLVIRVLSFALIFLWFLILKNFDHFKPLSSKLKSNLSRATIYAWQILRTTI